MLLATQDRPPPPAGRFEDAVGPRVERDENEDIVAA
jgi:hypothetical protein